MDPPHFLLDALTDSITSGNFVDTKLYVFSRREASRRVGSPRALYRNSRVLSTVSYLSACGCRKLVRRSPSNLTVWKCFQMDFRRDRRGTSTEDSPLTPALTPMTTTTCQTATSRTNPPKLTTPSCRGFQSYEFLSPHHPKIYHGRRRMQSRFKMTTSQPQCPSNRPTF